MTIRGLTRRPFFLSVSAASLPTVFLLLLRLRSILLFRWVVLSLGFMTVCVGCWELIVLLCLVCGLWLVSFCFTRICPLFSFLYLLLCALLELFGRRGPGCTEMVRCVFVRISTRDLGWVLYCVVFCVLWSMQVFWGCVWLWSVGGIWVCRIWRFCSRFWRTWLRVLGRWDWNRNNTFKSSSTTIITYLQ